MKISKILLSVVVAFSLGNATEIEVQLDPKLEVEMGYSDIIGVIKKDEMPTCVEMILDSGILEDEYWTSMLVNTMVENNSAKCLKGILDKNVNFKDILITDSNSKTYKQISIFEFIKKSNSELSEILIK